MLYRYTSSICNGSYKSAVPAWSYLPALWSSSSNHCLVISLTHHLNRSGDIKHDHFQTASHQHLYMLMLHTIHTLILMSQSDTKGWVTFIDSERPQWTTLYPISVSQPTGDIGRWVLHRAFNIGACVAQFARPLTLPSATQGRC